MERKPVSDRRRHLGWLTLGLLAGAVLTGLGARQALAAERQQLCDLVVVQMSQRDQTVRAYRQASTQLAARTLELLEAGDHEAATRELLVHVKMQQIMGCHDTVVDVEPIVERAQARLQARAASHREDAGR